MRLARCCVVVVSACATKPAATTPREPPTATSTNTATPSTGRADAQTVPTSNDHENTTPAVQSSGRGAVCLYVEPDHRAVRCYWDREDCEGQVAFNPNSKLRKKCEAVAEAHCFDEAGQPELCYPTASDCETTAAKFKARNRAVSQCAARRGPK